MWLPFNQSKAEYETLIANKTEIQHLKDSVKSLDNKIILLNKEIIDIRRALTRYVKELFTEQKQDERTLSSRKLTIILATLTILTGFIGAVILELIKVFLS